MTTGQTFELRVGSGPGATAMAVEAELEPVVRVLLSLGPSWSLERARASCVFREQEQQMSALHERLFDHELIARF